MLNRLRSFFTRQPSDLERSLATIAEAVGNYLGSNAAAGDAGAHAWRTFHICLLSGIAKGCEAAGRLLEARLAEDEAHERTLRDMYRKQELTILDRAASP